MYRYNLVLNRFAAYEIEIYIGLNIYIYIYIYIYMCVLGIGLVDSISLPVVPGSIPAVGRLAADSAMCNFTAV
jgi:hypothetical protein